MANRSPVASSRRSIERLTLRKFCAKILDLLTPRNYSSPVGTEIMPQQPEAERLQIWAVYSVWIAIAVAALTLNKDFRGAFGALLGAALFGVGLDRALCKKHDRDLLGAVMI